MATDRKYKSASEFPGELVVEGTFLNHQKEHRKWVKDGIEKEMDVDVIFMQVPFGICVVRCFNPSFNLDSLKAGDAVAFPVERFEKENGLKAFSVRI